MSEEEQAAALALEMVNATLVAVGKLHGNLLAARAALLQSEYDLATTMMLAAAKATTEFHEIEARFLGVVGNA